MVRTRERAKGRRGGEAEHFARLPEDVMRSAALATAPHAAFRVLAILVTGKAPERNGTMACTDSYAVKFGLNSRETVYRSLKVLQARGLIVVTRQGMRMRKIPTLWAVTWWPIHNRNGLPLDKEEPATFAYRDWTPDTPIDALEVISHTDNRGSVTPIIGAHDHALHTDSGIHSGTAHTDSREYSKSLGVGVMNQREAKVFKLVIQLPHLGDADVSKITGEPIEFVSAVRMRKAG